ncbi:L-serine ammonia-lyase, iron-sulfur-dependent subunit beta [uncultured Clostridium sp.]|jgi:L-serine dehydratase|uniref:L-serine ammonia-lyase, iron-sulfur-dependent subunit beta n=1 Tax=uncultured Clostridium sp. TaxID=59620 RepID=UPI002625BC90|nr:L-serine ammonia-lyase, iron-sulfur-dependent subunit beta [uncultured Clostridium sp.]
MKRFSVFDIIGPVMIGPSSSHTAGAARLGKVARTICGDEVASVTFLLHGSFAKTYKGHGTDKALVAGMLGMEPADKELRNSMEIAKSIGLSFEFLPTDLGEGHHPNTVKFLMKTKSGKSCEVMGSSIGGGNIVINEVNGQTVDFTGQYPTLIVPHKDVPGSISAITAILYKQNINVASLKVFRTEKGKSATMIFEVDNNIPSEMLEEIKSIEAVDNIIMIKPDSREV